MKWGKASIPLPDCGQAGLQSTQFRASSALASGVGSFPETYASRADIRRCRIADSRFSWASIYDESSPCHPYSMVRRGERDLREVKHLKELYSKQLDPSSWVSSADTLTVALHWLQPHLDEAEKQYQQQMRDKRAGREMPPDFMRPLFEILTARVFLMLAGYALEDLFKGYMLSTLPKASRTLGTKPKNDRGQQRRVQI